MKAKGFGVKVFLKNQLGHLRRTAVKPDGVNHRYQSQKGWPREEVLREFVRAGYQVARDYPHGKRAAYSQKLKTGWLGGSTAPVRSRGKSISAKLKFV